MLKSYLNLIYFYFCLCLVLTLCFHYFFTVDSVFILHLNNVVSTLSTDSNQEVLIDEVLKSELVCVDITNIKLDETDASLISEDLQDESYFQKVKNWTYNNRYYILAGTAILGTCALLYYLNKQPPIPSDGLSQTLSPEALEALNRKLEIEKVIREGREALEESRQMRYEDEWNRMMEVTAKFVEEEYDNMSHRVRLEKSGFNRRANFLSEENRFRMCFGGDLYKDDANDE